MCFTSAVVLTLVSWLSFTSLVFSQESTTPGISGPIQSDLEEEVEVRFVIIDALVLDSEGRVVTDLSLEDFKLKIDLYRHSIASVDLSCPQGAVEEPQAVRFGERRAATSVRGTTRRFALVIDYKNLPQTLRVEVVRRLKQMVRDQHAPDDELMVVAITNRLRIEQPFTQDTDLVLEALDRMENDVSLWQEHANPHFLEYNLFDALTALTRMLASYEGSKALVLFSDLPTKTSFDPWINPRALYTTPASIEYDRQFEAVATAATNARVAFYPIHSKGLTLQSSSHRLARLAVDTGGRFTEYTNDLSLTYARAQRDLACRYAVGFYDTKPETDQLHRLQLRVPGRGFRVYHPVHYRFGSSDEAQDSLAGTAFSAPLGFPGGSVTGQLIPVRPLSGRQWQAVVAMRFSASIPRTGENVVKFGAKLDDQARRAVHAIDRQLTVQQDDRGGERAVVMLATIDIAPGTYELSIVVNDPLVNEPRTSVVPFELPQLPRKGVYVVDPVLMRPTREEVIVHWDDDDSPLDALSGFEPTVPGQPVSTDRLMVVTYVCSIRSKQPGLELKVTRRILRTEDGRSVASFEPVTISVPTLGTTSCEALQDEVSTSSFAAGTYEFEVTAESTQDTEPIRRRSSFTVGPR